jgi:hypothetical protein
VFEVIGCEVNPAGGVDPCVNGKPPEKCYKAENCRCKLIQGNAQCVDENPANMRGDMVVPTTASGRCACSECRPPKYTA